MFGSGVSIVNRAVALRLTVSRQWSRLVAATVFPPRCCLCGFPGDSLDLDLCAFCNADLPWERTQPVGMRVALRYENPVDELIRRLKYHGDVSHARVLGVLLAQAVGESGQALPRLLVPVPLHIARLRERGFNQAFAIARHAGRMHGIPTARSAVRRIRDTPSQTSQGVEGRLENIRGAFVLAGASATRRLLAAGHVAIIDDVVTTGSTTAELRRVLLAAGVHRVDVWAAARAHGLSTPASARS